MALKFLNKKGWHTGSLRNIENVWKAEQKHEAEQKKLEELRKQILEERERSEFRDLQVQAGLVPKQERLDFLYDSGLSIGKGGGSSSKGGEQGVAFKALEVTNDGDANQTVDPSSSSSSKQPSAPGALFDDKPHSANDAWRKLHSDPLLLIKQREQDALARIKNNPVQMALIRKSVVAEKEEESQSHDKKQRRKKHKHSGDKYRKHLSSRKESTSDSDDKHRKHSSSRKESTSDSDDKHRKHSSSRKESNTYISHVEGKRRHRTRPEYDNRHVKGKAGSDDESSERESQRRKNNYRDSKFRDQSPSGFSDRRARRGQDRKDLGKSNNENHSVGEQTDLDGKRKNNESRNINEAKCSDSAWLAERGSHFKRRNAASKLSEEERAARLREMQADAELHEEQRWKRLRKAEEDDAREATRASMLKGRNFLDAANKSVYGAEKGGSSTIEESVRRRTHFSQGRSEVGDGNAFRR